MSISYIGTYGSTANNTVTVTYKNNALAGDFLVLTAVGKDYLPSSPTEWGIPIDYCESAGVHVRSMYRIATAAEPSVTVTVPSGALRVMVTVFRGVDTSNPYHDHSKGTSYGVEYSSVNGVSAEYPDTLIAHFVGFFDVASSDSTNYLNWYNEDVTLTERADALAATAGGAAGLAIATGVKSVPGYVGVTTATADSSVNYSATITLALTPAGSVETKSTSASNSIGVESFILIEKNIEQNSQNSIGVQQSISYEILVNTDVEIIEKDVISNIGLQNELVVEKNNSIDILSDLGINNNLSEQKIIEVSCVNDIGIENLISIESNEVEIRSIDALSEFGIQDYVYINKTVDIFIETSIGIEQNINVEFLEFESHSTNAISTIGIENIANIEKIISITVASDIGVDNSISFEGLLDYLELIGSVNPILDFQGALEEEVEWLGSLTKLCSEV